MNISHRNLRFFGLLLILLALMGISTPYSFSADAHKEIKWEEMIPKNWNPNSIFERFTDEEFSTMTNEQYSLLEEEWQTMLDAAPTVDSLDGQSVKIAGYLVPLEFDEAKIKEFLLVPYFGACTHTPPPPANQIIYGKSQSDFTMEELYKPVWISGKLKTIRSQKKLGESGVNQTIDVNTGYTMEVNEVRPYDL